MLPLRKCHHRRGCYKPRPRCRLEAGSSAPEGQVSTPRPGAAGRIATSPPPHGPARGTDGIAGTPLRFAPWKNGLSGVDLTMAAAAEAVRTPVKNRVDNQPIRTAVAIRRRRRAVRLRSRFWRCRRSRCSQSLRPSHAVDARARLSEQRATLVARDL